MSNKSYLSKTNLKHLKKLINLIKNNENVFIYGPNGLGKTSIVKAAIENLVKLPGYKCHLFDVEELSIKGGHAFYQKIIATIQSQFVDGLRADLSTDFINLMRKYLVEHSDQTTVLFFDHLNMVNRHLYDRFSEDCRVLIDEQHENLIMIFIGSRVSSLETYTSPLWSRTEKIEVAHLPKNEIVEICSTVMQQEFDIIKLDESAFDQVYSYTGGHIFLAMLITRFICKYHEDKYLINQSNIEDAYPAFISTLHKSLYTDEPIDFLSQKSQKKIKKHFTIIIKQLTQSLDLFHAVYNVYHQPKTLIDPITDNLPLNSITITGILTIDEKGVYAFSNDVYKEFISVFLKEPLLGDFCLYHAQDEIFWNIAKNTFVPLHKREQSSLFFSSFMLINRIREKIQSADDASKLAEEFVSALHAFFGISNTGIFQFADKPIIEENFYNIVNQNRNIKWIPKNWYNNNSQLIQTAIQKKYSMAVDWTGKYIAIQMNQHSKRQYFFIAEINSFDETFHQQLTDFVRDILSFYLDLCQKDETLKSYVNIKDDLKQISQKRPRRETMNDLWQWARLMIIEQGGVREFTFYEISIDEDWMIETSGESEDLNKMKNKISEEIFPIINSIDINKKGERTYKNNTYFFGQLDNNILIVIKYKTAPKEEHLLAWRMGLFFEYIYLFMNSMTNVQKEIIPYKNTLDKSDFYLYIMDKNEQVIYKNEMVTKQLPEDSLSTDLIKVVFETGINEKEDRIIFIDGNLHTFQCRYEPTINERDEVIAVSAHLYDMGMRWRIYQLFLEMERISELKHIDVYILNSLYEFGFSNVFHYRKIPTEKKSYTFMNAICEDLGTEKISEFQNDPHTLGIPVIDDHIAIYYTKQEPFEFIERFRKSIFKWYQIKTKDPKSPFLMKNSTGNAIIVPIISDDSVNNIFILTNNSEELDNQLFRRDHIELIEMFAKNASHLRENVKQRIYLKNMQRMMSHGTMEPLMILRNSIHYMMQMNDPDQKKKWANAANAAMELVQAGMGSLLTLERGLSRVKKKNICINDLLIQQTDIFKEYGKTFSGITIDIHLPQKKIWCNTDEVILTQILNNLIGNSLRHLQKEIEMKEKKIYIKLHSKNHLVFIYISDNGKGLPKHICDYFKINFQQGMNTPTSGLGLAYSREMADMLGGTLNLIQTKKGTSFKLTIKE